MRRRNLDLLPLLTRRDTLKGLGATLLAACATDGTDTGTKSGTTAGVGSVDHIIVVMMENRTFDHFLGAMKLLEGRELDGLTADMANAGADGTVYTPAPSAIDCLADPPHGWSSSHAQWNEGAMDGFVTEYEHDTPPAVAEVMGYMTRADLPITWALADNYAVCDRYFASVMGPTWPNRFYGHAGTGAGEHSNEMPTGLGTTWPSVWQKLEEIGVDWRYYYTDLPFLILIPGHDLQAHGALLEEFVADCAAGTLPPVCWLDPGFGYNDDHPPHHVGAGQEFLSIVYQALATSPLWDKCLLLLTYDEHGGFYDHVAPPTTEDDFAAEGLDQMGFRVPSIVVGPWVKPGVSSDTFDHTSWLKYICERFGIEPWTARIVAANSLGVLLDVDRLARNEPNPPADIPAFDFDDSLLGADCIGGGLGPTAPPDEAQAELRKFVAEKFPELDHSGDVPARIARLRKRT